ncbi:MAG: fibrobacter succinogenes major paralogous domain-containing protein [Bacteroidales bacterium]|nr:fibrobacter succinogenes major paralogous domain-containing protein [Bacteroidales bacterium]
MKHNLFFKMILFSALLILFSFYGCEKEDPEESSATITDIDGNVYKTVIIGTQTWMKENLKVTKYNNGTPIPLVTDDSEWIKLSREEDVEDRDAFCWYENDKPTYGDTYGALYNWYAAETGTICPTGWHVPTDVEWTTLIDYLGGESEAGGKMKEAGMAHWRDPNEGADNESGFTALPGGSRSNVYGNFSGIESHCGWWSQPKTGETSSRTLSISFNNESVGRGTTFKEQGHAVRCIKDE